MEPVIEAVASKQDTIKPVTPTPDHLRRYQLSFLDQTTPPFYLPWILFYPSTSNTNITTNGIKFDGTVIQKSNHLKQSLSQVLTYYYPLAGRIKDNRFVDCNDDGVPFVEAQVNCDIMDVIRNPIPIELRKLLPFRVDGEQECSLGIQFNVFKCGGVAVGVCLSHQLGDASSLFTFIKAWADISRGELAIEQPNFVSATLFPTRDLPDFYDPSIGITKSDIVVKRFVFDPTSIEALRAKYERESKIRPTRVETLSIFMWNRFVAATETTPTSNRVDIMLQAVNFRERMEQPIPKHAFGNYARTIMTCFSSKVDSKTLISGIRDRINAVYNEHVVQLREGVKSLEMIKELLEGWNNQKMMPLGFSSWCRFPTYEANFGWGKPLWAGTTALPLVNIIFLVDTQNGGIEVWVHLKNEDMAKFEMDHELAQYVI